MIAICTCPCTGCVIHGDRPVGVITTSGNISAPVYLSPSWRSDRAWKASEPSLSAAVAKVIERAKAAPPHPITETM